MENIVHGDSVAVIDDAYRIMEEYRRNVDLKTGQLGVGGRFMKWLLENLSNPHACEQVPITPLPDSPDGCDFAEFPDDAGLVEFDRDDRKFVAVAVASSLSPHIVNATDRGWWNHRVALSSNGIQVRFLCPELMLE